MAEIKWYTREDAIEHCEEAKEEKKFSLKDWLKKKMKSIFKNENNKLGRQDKIDCAMMLANLEVLRNSVGQDDKKKKFADFFESALVGAFLRYRRSKKQTWGFAQNVAVFVAGLIFTACSTYLASWLSGEGAAAGASRFALALAILAATLAGGYTKWHNMKNDKETWVRHSGCYNRLNLILQKFAFSARDDAAYDLLVKETFAVLEQNLDQFVLNLSTNGLAERSEDE